MKDFRKNENKIALAVSILSGDLSSSQSEQEVAQVHYNKAVKTLEEILKGIVSDSTYYELIDELDEGYNSDSSNLNSVILALLRARMRYTTALSHQAFVSFLSQRYGPTFLIIWKTTI